MRKRKVFFCIMIVFGLYLFYQSQNYEEIRIYPEQIKDYRISDVGLLNIWNVGTWSNGIYSNPYRIEIIFTPLRKKKIESIFIKKMTIICDMQSYELNIDNNKIENSENRYYFPYVYLLHQFKKGDLMKYDMVLNINNQDYNVEIPVSILYESRRKNTLLFLTYQ